MVIFGLVAEVSVGRLFLGGVVPGLIMTVALMIMVALYAQRNKYPRTPFPGFRELVNGFTHAFLPILTPVILLGGIWSGQIHPHRGGRRRRGVRLCAGRDRSTRKSA